MIDDILEQIVRRRKHGRRGGLRQLVGRAIAGEHPRDDRGYRRRYRDDDWDEWHRPRRTKRAAKRVFDFD